jgi:hypothetical protein
MAGYGSAVKADYGVLTARSITLPHCPPASAPPSPRCMRPKIAFGQDSTTDRSLISILVHPFCPSRRYPALRNCLKTPVFRPGVLPSLSQKCR